MVLHRYDDTKFPLCDLLTFKGNLQTKEDGCGLVGVEDDLGTEDDGGVSRQRRPFVLDLVLSRLPLVNDLEWLRQKMTSLLITYLINYNYILLINLHFSSMQDLPNGGMLGTTSNFLFY